MAYKEQRKERVRCSILQPSNLLDRVIFWTLMGAVILAIIVIKHYPNRGSALCAASAEGNTKVVESLLRAGVPVDYSGCASNDTPLMQAAQEGHLSVAQLLLERGASPSSRDIYGSTPLISAGKHAMKDTISLREHTSIEKRKIAIAQLLISRGADIGATDERGISASTEAAHMGYKHLADFLYRLELSK